MIWITCLTITTQQQAHWALLLIKVSFLPSFPLHIPSSPVSLQPIGSDWFWHSKNKSSLVNFFEYGRLWKDRALNVLLVISYVPENHHQNAVEHSWGPRTNDLAGIHFKPNVLNKSEKDISKELDEEVDLVTRLWNGKKYSNFPVTAISVPCLPITQPSYNDLEELSKELKMANIPQERKDQLLFFFRHAIKHADSLLFLNCKDKTCNHCTQVPIRSPKLLSCLWTKFSSKTPVTQKNPNTGHFYSFGELCTFPQLSILPDSVFGYSSESLYLFSSISDLTKYYKIIGKPHLAQHLCGWTNGTTGCTKTFPNSRALETHQQECGHLKPPKIKVEKIESKKNKRKAKEKEKKKQDKTEPKKKKHKTETESKKQDKTDPKKKKHKTETESKKKKDKPETESRQDKLENQKKRTRSAEEINPSPTKKSKIQDTDPPKRVEVLLDLDPDTTPGYWCGTVANQDNDDPTQWLIKFDDGDKMWINSQLDVFRPCTHGWNRTKLEK